MYITGTHFNYYHICHRKLWLFAHSIQMEQTSELVYEGKLIHESSYAQRNSKFEEVQLDGIKVDFYDAKNCVIHEIKKTDKRENAHEWQLKYYIYVFEKNGIDGVHGILEYPKMRKTEEIWLSDVDRAEIEDSKLKIAEIINLEHCPDKLKKTKCKNCSYFDFCFSGEDVPTEP